MSTNVSIERILETSLYARDLAAAEFFYKHVLGLELFAKEAERHVFFKCGNQMLLIFNPAKTSLETEVAPHGSYGLGHVAFAVPLADMQSWIAHLNQHGIAIEKDLAWPNGGRSIYFRDPVGNCLELASPLLWGMAENDLSRHSA